MDLNSRLKFIRKRAKVTQKEIAQYLDVTLRTYQRYEEGTIEPPISTLSAIAKFFDVPTDCLLGIGFYSNWEEILSHKEKILSAIKEEVPYIDELVDISSLTDNQLARFLPAIFDKITITESKITFTVLYQE